VRPIELVELSAKQFSRPYVKENPVFILFLERLSWDKAIPLSIDPIDVTVNISYQSASSNDKLESRNVVNYFRRQKSVETRFLGAGKVEPRPQ
jgi:hypothetical protein